MVMGAQDAKYAIAVQALFVNNVWLPARYNSLLVRHPINYRSRLNDGFKGVKIRAFQEKNK